MITTTDPRTGVSAATDLEKTSPEEVAAIAALAASAARDLASLGREFRAEMLDAMAVALEGSREQLVSTAESETGLTAARLNGELSRSAFQLSLFASAIREGSYLEAAIDHAGETPLGPQPDVRRMLVPTGPVAVFGSSNFPFAFSVLGGDVASALAAGCPVVAKAHGSHPLTSALSYETLLAAARSVGAPEGTIGIVYGQEAGTRLVTDPNITAVGFTGSLGAAEALQAAIATRPEPIPFFGELSSINPLVVTAGAAAARSAAIAEGLFASYTGSAGQLCTKPGLAFVPTGAAGDGLVSALASLTDDAGAGVLLNSRIRGSFDAIEGRLVEAGARALARGREAEGEGYTVPPTMLETTATELSAELAEECFGPMIVAVRYDSIDQVVEAIGRVPRSLTATVHSEPDEEELVADLAASLQPFAGRLVFNGYPTGVRVSWAQHHGGPWPATNTQHTSVGVTAIRRWLRPVAWQNAPAAVLPAELRDDDLSIPRRVDGVLVLPTR
ncbi:aldehyde dehydrogenase [Cnuibacter physcomitrellae]|uniref:Aldehyde dehydrogenase (NADP(+)) n=1 Tax=Cnuibacter physcomitrellae TaxID=1619308 RepID=A0A1X9LM36_9MICO|nr:aldehyde dehydrogenase family protein [Cnuibacter physcomitrellae]ARJ06254.1 aldehyde dehydrogenase (NADP(+)) [Cnuibacter physcomitrellae]GGI37576.1 aldehyde dehydrogenase [Cnuibacter physcomitrellae]